MGQVKLDIGLERRFKISAARVTQQLPAQQQVLQFAHLGLAHRVLVGELRNHLARGGRTRGYRREQQLGFLGVVQALWKLVHVKQHGAHHVKKLLRPVLWPALHQHAHGAQHGRQRGVFVVDDADAWVGHGAGTVLEVNRRLERPTGSIGVI